MLQYIVNGLVTGVLYSLMAIGFALVYNTTKVFHIAAAGIYVFAAYMFYSFSRFLPLIPSALIAIVLTMGFSLLTELLVYRPLWKRKASNNVAMIASIGMMTVIVNTLSLCYGDNNQAINQIKFKNVVDQAFLKITYPQTWQFVVGVIVIIVFLVFIGRKGWGTQIRALSANASLYETMGYSTSRTRTIAFLLAGALMAISSCLNSFEAGIAPGVGMEVLVYAMVAMIIGGVGRFGTCVIGGILLGVLQAIVCQSSEIPTIWQTSVTFVVLLLFLFFRPQGIAGYKQRSV